MAESKSGCSKSCFVISPIGEEGTPEREASNQVLNYIIRPAVETCGYAAVRADEISAPGVITTLVIQHLLEDDLIVADLTGRNPNVFYELAIRHAVRKPFIHIIRSGERLPFDVAHIRTIKYERDLASADTAKREIEKAIQSSQDELYTDNPLFRAIAIESLRSTGNAEQNLAANILTELGDFRGEVRSILEGVARSRDTEILSETLTKTISQEIKYTVSDAFGGIGEDDAKYIRGELDQFKNQLENALMQSNRGYENPDEVAYGDIASMLDELESFRRTLDDLISLIDRELEQSR